MEGAGDLIDRFKGGDESAVREIVQRYGGAVQTIARSMMRSDELIAETVQQTFVKAWRGAASFDETREFAPWLYSIARRTAIDILRREGRHETEPHDDEVASENEMTFERTWEIYEVRSALDALPAEERDVMRLSFLEGLTHEQIAERLGVPIGTVKSRTGRAKKRLLQSLKHLGANQTGGSNVEGGEAR